MDWKTASEGDSAAGVEMEFYKAYGGWNAISNRARLLLYSSIQSLSSRLSACKEPVSELRHDASFTTCSLSRVRVLRACPINVYFVIRPASKHFPNDVLLQLPVLHTYPKVLDALLDLLVLLFVDPRVQQITEVLEIARAQFEVMVAIKPRANSWRYPDSARSLASGCEKIDVRDVHVAHMFLLPGPLLRKQALQAAHPFE
jgi:hypothetical protein